MQNIIKLFKCPETNSSLTAFDHLGKEIEVNDNFDGVLILLNNQISRWFPVLKGIPSLLKDDIRDKSWDSKFYENNKLIFSKLGINKSCFNNRDYDNNLNDRFENQRFVWGEQPNWDDLYGATVGYQRPIDSTSRVINKNGFFSKNLDCYYGEQPQFQDFVKDVNGNNNKIILDVGCGEREKEEFFKLSETNSYIGIDIVGESGPTIQSSGSAIPLVDSSVDYIICDSVLEHVSDPFDVANEIFRVLKPGGRGYFVIPFSYKNHGAPFDFYRYTKSGLHALLKNYSKIRIYSFGGYVHAFSHMIESFYPHLPFGIGRILKAIHNSIFFFLNKVDRFDKYKLFSRGFYAFVTK